MIKEIFSMLGRVQSAEDAGSAEAVVLGNTRRVQHMRRDLAAGIGWAFPRLVQALAVELVHDNASDASILAITSLL